MLMPGKIFRLQQTGDSSGIVSSHFLGATKTAVGQEETNRAFSIVVRSAAFIP